MSQKDLEPPRLVGLMRMLLKSRNLLGTLTPNDRVAILSFPDLAMRRLSGALAGYYVLFVEHAGSRRIMHDIEVELTRHKGSVLATSSYSERSR